MTINEKIIRLNSVIILLHKERNRFVAAPHSLWRDIVKSSKQNVLDVLDRVEADKSVVEDIDSVLFIRSDHPFYIISDTHNNDAYINAALAGFDTMISILNEYKKVLSAKQNYCIIILTLIFSAIAAIGTLLSFIF